MKHDVIRTAEKYRNAHNRKRRWQRVVTLLAAIVVFCTTYALILPAITLSVNGNIELDGGSTGFNTVATHSTILEAENAVISGDGEVVTDNAVSASDSYVINLKYNGTLTFNFYVPEAYSDCILQVRAGTMGTRELNAVVNGVSHVIGGVATGSWTVFDCYETGIQLQQGENTIVIQSTGNTELPNFDYINILGADSIFDTEGGMLLTVNRLEAEDAIIVDGNISDNTNASGGAHVGGSQTASLTFEVYSMVDAVCNLKVHYAMDAGPRAFKVRVNDEYTANNGLVEVEYTGSWNDFMTKAGDVEVSISLKEGRNVIVLEGTDEVAGVDSTDLPPMDYIEITPVETTLTLEAEGATIIHTEGSVAGNSTNGEASGGLHVGNLVKGDELVFKVNLENPKQGTLAVAYISAVDNRGIMVKVNGEIAYNDAVTSSGSWTTPNTTAAIDVSDYLINGENEIIITGSTAVAATSNDLPNIDCITITYTPELILTQNTLEDSVVLQFDFDKEDFGSSNDGVVSITGSGLAQSGAIIPQASSSGVTYKVDDEGQTYAYFDGSAGLYWKPTGTGTDPMELLTDGVSTISMWIKPEDAANGKDLFAYDGGDADNDSLNAFNIATRFSVNSDDGGKMIYYRNAAGGVNNQKFGLTANAGITANEWNLITLVQEDVDTVTLYINGTKVNSMDIAEGHRLADIIASGEYGSYYIGTATDNDNPFVGGIDHFTIYNKALNETEVAALYNARHEIKVVQADEVSGATVKLFNYTSAVNKLPQANLADSVEKPAGSNDNVTNETEYGFRFFHGTYNGMDPNDSSVDGEGYEYPTDTNMASWYAFWNRNTILMDQTTTVGNVGVYKTNDTVWPVLNAYHDPSGGNQIEKAVKDLSYLGTEDARSLRAYFDENYRTFDQTGTDPNTVNNKGKANEFYVTTMENGGGLFRLVDGYYIYDSAQNAAWYDQNANLFELYDHVVRPVYQETGNDVQSGNFLPFNQILMGDNEITNHVTCNVNEEPNNAYQTESDGNAPRLQLTEPTDLWFGMTVEFDFYMPKDGQVAGADGTMENMVFDFYGDDDVYVIIDDVLVLNIGGIHAAYGGTIDFHTGEVTMGADSRANTTLAELFKAAGYTDEDLNGDTLADYSKHTLKFFYMERGGNISYCRLKFNMPTLPTNSLTVKKDLDDTDVTLNQASKETKYKFRVMQANEDGTASDKLYIPAGYEYEILLNDQKTGDTGKVDENGYFYLKDGESALFTDLIYIDGMENVDRYVVQEVLPLTSNGQYSITVNKEAMPLQAEVTDSTSKYIGTTNLSETEANVVVYTNKVESPVCTLTITKEAAANSEFVNDPTFNMQVTLGGALIPVGTAYTVTHTDGTTTDATVATLGIIPLKIGETATITGILAGTEFDIIEQGGEQYNVIYSGQITTTDPDSIQSLGAGLKNHISGTFTYKSNVAITVTNASYDAKVEIPVTKEALDNITNETFRFPVEKGTWDAATRTWKKADDDNGITISVKANEVAQANIFLSYKSTEVGTHTYKVYEAVGTGSFIYDDTFYIVTVNVADDGNGGITANVVEVLKNGTQQEVLTDLKLPFVNQATTTVTINKTVTGVTIDETVANQEFDFEVTVVDKNGAIVRLPESDSYTQDEGGVVRFSLKHSGSLTLTGIPIGATVQTTEVEYAGFIPSVQVETIYEAESGLLTGTSKITEDVNDGTSNDKAIDYIEGSASTCTIANIYSEVNGGVQLYIRYATDEERVLGVVVNSDEMISLICPDHGSWKTYRQHGDINPVDIQLQQGTNNKIVFSTVNNGKAPNLDRIVIVQPQQVAADSTTQVVNGATTINFTNQTGYQLPNTGSTGTNLYTILGGALLILAVAASTLVMYKNRRKEEQASK